MKLKKALIAALSVTVVMAAALCMAACDGGAATQTGAYLSENNLTYSNFLPQYNYFTATSTTQQLDTFDDDTYCLAVLPYGVEILENERPKKKEKRNTLLVFLSFLCAFLGGALGAILTYLIIK